MKNTHALSVAALFSVLAFQLPALATDASSASSEASSAVSSEPSSAPSSEPSSSMSSEPSSSMSSEPSAEPAKDNWGSLISALQAGKSADLTTITDATVVNFVTVSSLKDSGNTNALDNALDKNKAAVDQLRTDVGASEALSAKLTAAGYEAADVLAVVAEADGSITVYVDDRA
jgi:hypothetical protein